jgi:hypothetical protein
MRLYGDRLWTLNMIVCGKVDKICWIPSKRKLFEVNSYYQVLSTIVRSHFPWNSMWKVKASSRVALFVWTVTLGKILTLDNLGKQNVM